MHWISTLVEEFTPYREEEEEEVSLSTVYTVYWSDNPDKIHWHKGNSRELRNWLKCINFSILYIDDIISLNTLNIN
jgi:hypothetical protein